MSSAGTASLLTMPEVSDQSVRERALDPTTSFIVQAPAGSGKTELLIRRYVGLVSRVRNPESVVAITFTRKAAAEMRTRAMGALRSRDGFQHLLDNPSRMRIQTIDALSASIVRQMPWVARFGALPEVNEKADDLYREAARRTLARVEEEPDADGPISTLVLHLDNDFRSAETLIAQMLAKRDQWLRHTGVNPDTPRLRAQLEALLKDRIAQTLARLEDCFPPALQRHDRAGWEQLADALLTKGGEWRKGNWQVDELKCQPGVFEALQDLMRLPPDCFEDEKWRVMEAVIEVLPKAVAELHGVFRERGRIDFQELSLRASEALGKVDDPSDLALTLGHRIEHLLVDEFQDTSYLQYDLIEKLTTGWEPGDGRTLFIVGDPMQSIYRFREAEVGLFLKARRHGIGAIRLEPLTLQANFRSTPAIVDWINATFSEHVFPKQEHIQSGAVPYSPSSAQRESEPGATGPVIHAFVNPGPQDEATRVVELIQNSSGGSTGVLVRARSHLTAIVAQLRARGIPFQAVEIDELGRSQLIQDLMALTFALLHPADRVSWLAILRAPWCGLRLADLHAIAAHPDSTIWDLLHQPLGSISADARSRLARVVPVLEKAMAQRGRQGLRRLVELTWMRLGGPACVETDSALEDATAYFDLLEGMEQGGDLPDFQFLRDQVSTLFAQSDSRADGRLQIMTIHKAKGLEFETVIVPGLGQRPRSEDRELLIWSEQEDGMLLAPVNETGRDKDRMYGYVRHLENQKDHNEITRLLYVAVTRARTHLHLVGCATVSKNRPEPTPAKHSFLYLLWPAVGHQFILEQGHAQAAAPGIAQTRTLRRFPAGWSAPAPPERVHWRRQNLDPIEHLADSYVWPGDAVRHAGTVVHEFLHRIARTGVHTWSRESIRSRLANLGVSPLDTDSAAARVETALAQTLRDPRGQWILAQHADTACEYEITGLIEGKLCQVAIDRTFVDEQGVRWLIDYKTSAPEANADAETFFESELQKYKEQLERYARLMVQRDDRPIRLGLYFPLAGGWREWAAPTVKRRQASLFE